MRLRHGTANQHKTANASRQVQATATKKPVEKQGSMAGKSSNSFSASFNTSVGAPAFGLDQFLALRQASNLVEIDEAEVHDETSQCTTSKGHVQSTITEDPDQAGMETEGNWVFLFIFFIYFFYFFVLAAHT